MDRDGFAWTSLQFDDWVGFRFVWVDVLVVSAGFKTIQVDLHRFCWILVSLFIVFLFR